MRSIISLSGASLVLSATLAAQQPAPSDPGAQLRGVFEEVTELVVKGAEQVPADKYGFQPNATVRTFGQLVAHIADGNIYYCARAGGQKVEWSDAVEKSTTDKAAIMTKLKASIAQCAALHAKNSTSPQLLSNYGHLNLHYGNMITYLRLMGMVPPSS